MDAVGIGELPHDLDPQLAIVWQAVVAVYPKLAEHVTGPTPRAGITLATVVRAFHEQTVATGATVYPGLLAGLFERYPEGPFYARCFADRSVTDSLVEDITKLWMECIEALRKAQEPPPGELQIVPAVISKISDIPPRPWAYGRFMLFGSAAVIGAVDGAGKGTIAVGMLLAYITGLPLLGERIWRKGPVVILAYEDDQNEWRRRIAAGCIHHKLDYETIIASVHFVDKPGDKVTLAQQTQNGIEFPDHARLVFFLKLRRSAPSRC